MPASSQVTIHPAALAAIYEHASQQYPKECCGIVFGTRGEPDANRVRICENIQDALHAEDPERFPRDAHTAFNFDPTDLLVLNKSLRGTEPAKVIYHSHPNVGAYFSDTDQAVAIMDGEPAYPVEYLVVDVRADGAHGSAQFAWDADLGRYVEVKRYP